MTGLRLLDLYSGAGGAARGYMDSGLFAEIVGVDINPQPRYPYTFVQGDAVTYLREHWQEFDAVHASPPCQPHSWAAARWSQHRDDTDGANLLPATREALKMTTLPWVIENVVGAPLVNPVTLCGVMFDLEVIRHRRFESNTGLIQPIHIKHQGTVRDGTYVTVAGHGGDNAWGRGSRKDKQDAMNIHWMNDEELNEAIPPAYTEWIANQWKAANVLSFVRVAGEVFAGMVANG